MTGLRWGGKPVEEPQLPFDGTDQAESERRKDLGIEKRNADTREQLWRAAFDDWVRYLASTHVEFTTETVLANMGVRPKHQNTVGAAMNAAARKGIVKRVGYRKAERAKRHSAVISVWIGA